MNANENGILVTLPMIQGQMAMWVCRQHPFMEMGGVQDVNAVLTIKATESDGWLTPHILAMKWFKHYREIEAWVRTALAGHAQLEKWNTPRIATGRSFVAVTAVSKPKPEYDFIDIDALLRNVARGAWHEAATDSDTKCDGAAANTVAPTGAA